MNKKILFGAIVTVIVLTGITFAVNFVVNNTGIEKKILEIHKLNKLKDGSWEIVGKTLNINDEIVISVYNPDGVVITEDKIFANSDGDFSTKITTGGPLFRHAGFYKITAQQNNDLEPDDFHTFEITELEVQGKLDFIKPNP